MQVKVFYNKYAARLGNAEEVFKYEMTTISREIHRESEIFPALEKLMDVLIKEFSKKFLLSFDKLPLNAM